MSNLNLTYQADSLSLSTPLVNTNSPTQPQGHLQSYFNGTNSPFSIDPMQFPTSEFGNEKETSQYFYHSDHLGSTSYITNVNGEISQHIEYFPFGETFMEEHNATDEYSHYKFNGKELDQETGLYYYGARYYDPQISMWYGVDPMASKYPMLSPYMYTAGNPVMLIDPDGEDIATHPTDF
jgi:RHS repeat-associated protein